MHCWARMPVRPTHLPKSAIWWTPRQTDRQREREREMDWEIRARATAGTRVSRDNGDTCNSIYYKSLRALDMFCWRGVTKTTTTKPRTVPYGIHQYALSLSLSLRLWRFIADDCRASDAQGWKSGFWKKVLVFNSFFRFQCVRRPRKNTVWTTFHVASFYWLNDVTTIRKNHD